MDKGRRIVSGSEGALKTWKMLLYMGTWMAWMFTGFLVLAWGLLMMETVISVAFLVAAAFFAVMGILQANLASRVRPLHLHENGIDNFLDSRLRFTFKPFNEIEWVSVWVEDDSGAIRFFIRSWWPKEPSILNLRKEDRQKERLLEIVEFLKSRCQKVVLKGKAENWISEGVD